MNPVWGAVRGWLMDAWRAWDRFWFTPEDAATLSLVRVLAGAMLFYTHLVWTRDLTGFFGANGLLSREFVQRYQDSPFAWSHLLWFQNNSIVWLLHLVSLVVFAALTLGFKSRLASVAAFLLTVSYANRAGGALFGLDQINGFLAFCLMFGPCGDAFSVDAWLRGRRSAAAPPPTVSANVAIRLMQLHLCIVYLFAGTGKLLGETWWDGTALWGAFANYEYQTLDMTWLSNWPVIVNFLTHVTLAWEVSYAALIWPRLTRPVMLLLAIPLHLGIAFCMGMVTFGLIMLVANMAFIPAAQVRRWAAYGSRRFRSPPPPQQVETTRIRPRRRKPVH